jgi:hypothetical protein
VAINIFRLNKLYFLLIRFKETGPSCLSKENLPSWLARNINEERSFVNTRAGHLQGELTLIGLGGRMNPLPGFLSRGMGSFLIISALTGHLHTRDPLRTLVGG